jgi:hypothetical protein
VKGLKQSLSAVKRRKEAGQVLLRELEVRLATEQDKVMGPLIEGAQTLTQLAPSDLIDSVFCDLIAQHATNLCLGQCLTKSTRRAMRLICMLAGGGDAATTLTSVGSCEPEDTDLEQPLQHLAKEATSLALAYKNLCDVGISCANIKVQAINLAIAEVQQHLERKHQVRIEDTCS